MKDYDSNDPIREVSGKSIFSKLKSFEEDEEYNFEKEMEQYEKSISKGQLENNNIESKSYNNQNIALTKFITCIVVISPILIMMIFFVNIFTIDNYINTMPFETSLGSETPELNDEFDLQILSKTTSINFENAGNIVSLYKYDKNTKANWCDFTENDERFNGGVNTLQINYDSIPDSSKESFKKGLLSDNFEFVSEYPTGYLYAINKDNGYFLFVLISDNNIIYGAANGEYQNFFGE